MKNALICLLLGAAAAPVAAAQWEDDWEVWQTETELGATALLAPDAGESFLYRAWAEASRDRILDNGAEIGATGRIEVQRDHPARTGFSGIPSGAAGTGPGLQGAFTGFGAGLPPENRDVRFQLEKAYLYFEGGYGELRAGRDEGVALRFREGAPSVFETVAAGGQLLDPDGSDTVTTRHDLTGPAVKLSYTTPRLIGLQLGISYTPAANVRGLDRDPDRPLPGAAPVSLRNAAEGAVSFSHLLRESGVRVRASAAASSAEVSVPAYAAPAYDRVHTWSLGGSAEFDTVTLGASWLSSSNGIDGAGDYEAWTAGLTKQIGKYVLGAEYGESSDELTGLDGDVWSVGVSRTFRDMAKLSLGYRESGLEGVPAGPSMATDGLTRTGVVIEITLFR